MGYYTRPNPISYDSRLKASVRFDKLHHANERNGYVGQYQDGLGWQAVAPYQVSSTNTVEYTASDTYTPPSNLVYCVVICQGSGGGGGGADPADVDAVAAGGGAGAAAVGTFLAADLGTSVTLTINDGGTAGANTGGNGGNGGSVSFGVLLVANGGKGGEGTDNNNALGGEGGVGGTGAQIMPGEAGLNARPNTLSGRGGHSMMGAGGAGRTSAGNGNAGTRGSGGGGANTAGSQQTGGAGGKGVISITEYLA